MAVLSDGCRHGAGCGVVRSLVGGGARLRYQGYSRLSSRMVVRVPGVAGCLSRLRPPWRHHWGAGWRGGHVPLRLPELGDRFCCQCYRYLFSHCCQVDYGRNNRTDFSQVSVRRTAHPLLVTAPAVHP